MARRERLCRLPGWLATSILILVTCVWTYWGVAELFYEGWGLPFPDILRYLLIPATCLGLTLIALTWPRIGGLALITLGIIFFIWWMRIAAGRGILSWQWALVNFPLSGGLAFVGILFLLEASYRSRLQTAGFQTSPNWLRRNLHYILAVGFPALVAIILAAYYAPLLLQRIDDGSRAAQKIQGNGVTLMWAPQGPGWNWKQSWGGYPSWDSLAWYGVSLVGLQAKPSREGKHASQLDMRENGLCRYLSADGSTLMDTPQDIWRMPTTQEIVRSLVGQGQNAGCTWDSASDSAECQVQPNKDTPLWAPDQEPIYYWSGDEFDSEDAWYVPYTGGIDYGGSIYHQPKEWGNPRHGYRCVREP